MPRQKRDIEAALTVKGFLPGGGDHNFFVYMTMDGKKTRARTKTSHTAKMKDVSEPNGISLSSFSLFCQGFSQLGSGPGQDLPHLQRGLELGKMRFHSPANTV